MARAKLARVSYFVPEIGIFVFVTVCALAILLKGASPRPLLLTLPVTATAVLAIVRVVRRRESAACS